MNKETIRIVLCDEYNEITIATYAGKVNTEIRQTYNELADYINKSITLANKIRQDDVSKFLYDNILRLVKLNEVELSDDIKENIKSVLYSKNKIRMSCIVKDENTEPDHIDNNIKEGNKMSEVYDIAIEGLIDGEINYLGSTYDKEKAEETVSLLNFLATNGEGVVLNNHLTGDVIISIMKSKCIDSINYKFFKHHVECFDKEGIKLEFDVYEDEESEIPYKYILICDNEENHNITFIINRFSDFDSAKEMAAKLGKIQATKTGNGAYENMKSVLDEYGIEKSDYLLQNLHWSLEPENQSTMRFRIMSDVYGEATEDGIDNSQYHHKTVELIYTDANGVSRLLASSENIDRITTKDIRKLAVEFNDKFSEIFSEDGFRDDISPQKQLANLEAINTYIMTKLKPYGINACVNSVCPNTRFYSYEIVS